MAVALHTTSIHTSRRAQSLATNRSGGVGDRVSGVRSARNIGHLKVIAGQVAVSRPVATPAIYRRRRMVVGSVIAVLLGLVAGIGMVGKADAGQATVSNIATPHMVIAKPGDTLWAIARRLVPQGNITDLVDELVRLNGQEIQAGQTVRLPG